MTMCVFLFFSTDRATKLYSTYTTTVINEDEHERMGRGTGGPGLVLGLALIATNFLQELSVEKERAK